MSKKHHKTGHRKVSDTVSDVGNSKSSLTKQALLSVVKGGIIIIITGVANAIFGNLFYICGIAIKGSSRSLLQKFFDVYYISASRFEVADMGIFPWMMSCELCFFIALYGCRRANDRIGDLEQYLEETKLMEMKISENDGGKGSTNEHVNKREIKERITKLRNTITKHLSRAKIIKWIILILATVSMSTLIFDCTLTLSSYSKVKLFHKSVTSVRPFISENEFYNLNRQWVMMKSCRDYKAIKAKIAEYEKRADPDKKPDSEDK